MSSEKLWTPSSKRTDYGFENGLQVAKIDSGLRQGKTIQLATQEDMRRLAEESYNSNHMNKTVEQLRDPRYIRVFSGLGRVGIEVAIFGNENANKIQAVLYGWGRKFPSSKRNSRSRRSGVRESGYSYYGYEHAGSG